MSHHQIVTLVTNSHQVAVAAYVAMEVMSVPPVMNPPVYNQRLCWSKFMEKNSRIRNISRHLRMSKGNFDKLLLYLLPGLID
jgi:hypothetical protein